MNATNTISNARNQIYALPKVLALRSSNIATVMGLAFPAIFLGGTTALEIYQPGYNRVSNTISELVWGPAGWVENLMFVAFALTLVLLGMRIMAARLPLLAAALGFAVIAVFPTQAPDSAPTFGSLVHQYTAQGIAAALPVACFMLARTLRKCEEHRFLVMCSLTGGVIGATLNLAGLVAIYADTNWIGGIERLIVLNGLIWIQLSSIHLWLADRKAREGDRFQYRNPKRCSVKGPPAMRPVMASAFDLNENHAQRRYKSGFQPD
ncbi:DUF998 domain-containing protein [Dehalogenimonas formicexedens]|uniref:DUF998 domain-containing protein n=1 Tax=Dehalogenimonas formicexedens TaxID=1839801 RepID=UPI001314B5E3|nr:DUF998 domain-containing protein [Dehalogenimonas formicexedens]